MEIEKFESAPCIFVYNDCFSSDNFISLVEKESSSSWPYMSWVSSTTGSGGGGITSEYRSSLSMSLLPIMTDEVVERLEPLRDSFRNEIFEPLEKCVWDYRAANDLHLDSGEPWSLLKYSMGAEYHIHHDHGPANSRTLSAVAALGDGFEGGELEFNKFNIKIKLKKNSLILFPSNFPYTHIAHPVTSGIKYSLVTWFS